MVTLTPQQRADVLLAEWQRQRALPPEQRERVMEELFTFGYSLTRVTEDGNVETGIHYRTTD